MGVPARSCSRFAAGVPIVLAPMFADQLTALATGRTRTA
jgi:hypothetical protein